MAEGAAAADEEADAELFGLFEDFFVAYRAAGFNHGADSGFGRELYRVGEGEECVGGHDGALRLVFCHLYRVFRRVDAVCEAAADSYRCAVFYEDYSVALGDRRGLPGEDDVVPELGARRAVPLASGFLRKRGELVFFYEPAAAVGRYLEFRRVAGEYLEDAEVVLLFREVFRYALVEVGSGDYLEEGLRYRLRAP